MANKNRHTIVAVFVVFLFILSQFLYVFPLVSPYLLLFHDILEPQNSPPNEVTDIYRERAEYCFESTVSEQRTH